MTRARLLVPLLFSLAWLAVAAIWGSDIGGGFDGMFVLLVVAAIWSVLYIVRLGIYVWRQIQKNSADSDSLLAYVFWSIEPISFVAVLLFVQLGTFSELRFRLSEEALVKFAADVRAGRVAAADHTSVRVGFFRVNGIHLEDNGVVKLEIGSHLFGEGGLAHSPAGRPPNKGRDSYSSFHNQWWHWRRESVSSHAAGKTFETAVRLLQDFSSYSSRQQAPQTGAQSK